MSWSQGDVDGAVRLALSQGSLFDFDPAAARDSFEEINLRKRRRPRARRRRRTPMCGRSSVIRWCSPPVRPAPARPGSRSRMRVQLFERKDVDRIVLSRPAVEAGERLGFLPGDMREKVDPYLRPIYDALL